MFETEHLEPLEKVVNTKKKSLLDLKSLLEDRGGTIPCNGSKRKVFQEDRSSNNSVYRLDNRVSFRDTTFRESNTRCSGRLWGCCRLKTLVFVLLVACFVDTRLQAEARSSENVEPDLGPAREARLRRRVGSGLVHHAECDRPENCMRFLENRGMEYFLECLKHFPDKEELLRNMMGLLGNVAEVVELRPHLMDKLFLTVFYDLLDSSSDGIEVSYSAAGVLAHMASDGPEAWTVDEPSRDAVLERIASAVDRWDRRAERNTNCRSFKPILTLLNAYHTPQCQLWAVWALANLTYVNPNKYCSLVKAEVGLKLLYDIMRRSAAVSRKIKDLAMIVILNCVGFDKWNAAQRADTPA